MGAIVYWYEEDKVSSLELKDITADDEGKVEEKKRCQGKFKKKWYPCIPILDDLSTPDDVASGLLAELLILSCNFRGEEGRDGCQVERRREDSLRGFR